MVVDSDVAVAVDSLLVVVSRPPPAPRVPRGGVRSAMTMMTALVAAVRLVAVVIVGITMVVMDFAVVVAVCVVPLGPRLMGQMVSALAWFPGIFLHSLQALCAWTSTSAQSWTFVL